MRHTQKQSNDVPDSLTTWHKATGYVLSLRLLSIGAVSFSLNIIQQYVKPLLVKYCFQLVLLYF